MRFDLAVVKEREGAKSGRYPANWPEIAKRVKDLADWKCERCGRPNDYQHGYTLTVHHLDGDKWNLELWNLAALCQRCHLQVQNRVDFYTDSLNGVHREWMAKHVQGYNDWAREHDRPLLRLTQVIPNKTVYEYPQKKL